MIIGLGHRARSGKDTTADYLVRHYGFAKIAFADPLKKAARAIFGFSDYQVNTDKETIDAFWSLTPRVVLQKMGAMFREEFGDNVWVRTLNRSISKNRKAVEAVKDLPEEVTKPFLIPNWVIPDVRYMNEAEAVKSWGGILIRLNRDGGPINGIAGHPSEEELANYQGWDYTIQNQHELENLYRQIDLIMDMLNAKKLVEGRP